jgi:hypothetical protein
MLTFATPFFHIGLGSEIRDEQILGSGSGIKHPGSATLTNDDMESIRCNGRKFNVAKRSVNNYIGIGTIKQDVDFTLSRRELLKKICIL